MKVRTVFISVFCALVAVFSGNRLFLLFAGLGLVGLLDGLGLSEVETDGLYLYVSNLLRKGRVPLTDVAEVSLGGMAKISNHRGSPRRDAAGPSDRLRASDGLDGHGV
jgi:cytochrome c-type biogenesis protein CcmE